MFVEGRHDVNIPFYIHVDVASKLIMGYVGESRFSSSKFSDVIDYLSSTEYYARDRYGIFI